MIKFLWRFTLLAGMIAFTTISQSCKKSKGPRATPRTDITADLAGGAWFAQHEMNSNDYSFFTVTAYNTSDGVWFGGARDPWDMRPQRPGNGIKFTSKGDFEWLRFSDGGVGGLQSYTFFYVAGTAEQNNKEIKIYSNRHRKTYYSTSDPSLNFDEEVEDITTSFTYTITRYQTNWDQLDIAWADGSSSTYYRPW